MLMFWKQTEAPAIYHSHFTLGGTAHIRSSQQWYCRISEKLLKQWKTNLGPSMNRVLLFLCKEKKRNKFRLSFETSWSVIENWRVIRC